MTVSCHELPDWYPLANAPEATIKQWIAAESPPLAKMREALPWLYGDQELHCWLAGTRQAALIDGGASMRDIFPGIAHLPLPPKRAESCE